MKAGQMASMMDFGRLPSDELEEVQARFVDLRDSASQVPFKEMQKVIERELGERISDLFCEFDPDAAAAACTLRSVLGRSAPGKHRGAVGVLDGVAALGFFDPGDQRIDPSRLLAHVRALNAWYAEDELVTLTREYVSRVLRDAGDPAPSTGI